MTQQFRALASLLEDIVSILSTQQSSLQLSVIVVLCWKKCACQGIRQVFFFSFLLPVNLDVELLAASPASCQPVCCYASLLDDMD